MTKAKSPVKKPAASPSRPTKVSAEQKAKAVATVIPESTAKKVAKPAAVAAKAKAAKPAAKPVVKPVVKPVAKPAAAVEKVKKVEKVEKKALPVRALVSAPVGDIVVKDAKAGKKNPAKKPKLVRDSFTFPETDYIKFTVLKQRALKAGRDVKKSELLRAGLAMLSGLDEPNLIKVLDGIDKLKPGRPAK